MGIPADLEGWGERLTRSIAAEIKRRRTELRWSAQKLSDACGELGFEFPRSTLADLESGRRKHLSVAELIALAAALGVPPLLLIYPVGRKAEAEVWPGEVRPAFRSALWFSGEAAVPVEAVPGGEVIDEADWHSPARPLVMYRENDAVYRKEIGSLDTARQLAGAAAVVPGANQGNAAASVALWRDAAESHRETGERIRAAAAAEGLIPPSRIMGVAVCDTKETEEKSS